MSLAAASSACADTKSTFIVLAYLLNAIFTHYRNPLGR